MGDKLPATADTDNKLSCTASNPAISLRASIASGSTAEQALLTAITLDLLATTPTNGTNIRTYHTKGINMHTYHISAPWRALRSMPRLNSVYTKDMVARLKRFVAESFVPDSQDGTMASGTMTVEQASRLGARSATTHTLLFRAGDRLCVAE
jgi:hypothetical protein